jgi:steroid 5-alpha reductase family enzyme
MFIKLYLIALPIFFAIAIAILILKVSGIPMLEKKIGENPEFAEYKKRTSI